MTLEEALWRSVGASRGIHWVEFRRSGATDEQLREAIERAHGIWGGFSGPGEPGYVHSGLRFWHGSDRGEDGKTRRPTLSGQALVDATRRLLAIPLPKDHAQQMEMEL